MTEAAAVPPTELPRPLSLTVIRGALRLLSVTAPGVASRVAADLFMTPRRFAAPPRAQEVRGSGSHSPDGARMRPARGMHSFLGMRTHQIAFYVALFIGVVVAVVLSTASGLWIDQHLPIGGRGFLLFLGAAAAIVLVVETFAGFLGDWIDELRGRKHARR